MHAPRPESIPDAVDQISITTFLKKWYYFAVTVPVCLGLGIAHYLLVTPTYMVTARVLVEERGRPLTPQNGGSLDRNFLPTHAEILKSPAVIDRAISKMPPIEMDDEDDSPIDDVLKRLKVEPLVGTNVLSVTYTDEAPSRAINGLNEIIQSYKQYLSASEQSAHKETIVLLSQRADNLRNEIRGLQSEYQTIRNDSPLLGNDSNAAQVQRNTLIRLGDELVATKSRRIALENQLESLVAMQKQRNEGDFQFVAKPGDNARRVSDRQSVELLSRLNSEWLLTNSNLQTDLQTLLNSEVEYSELRKKLGEKHPDVIAVQVRIEALEERLGAVVDAAPDMIRRESQSLQRREEELALLYEKEFTEAKTMDQYLVKEEQKLAEIVLVKSAYDTIMMQLNELQVADQAVSEGRASVSVRVLDGPELADELVWPQLKPLLGICLIAGIASGLGLIFVSEKLWHREQGGTSIRPQSQMSLNFPSTSA